MLEEEEEEEEKEEDVKTEKWEEEPTFTASIIIHVAMYIVK